MKRLMLTYSDNKANGPERLVNHSGTALKTKDTAPISLFILEIITLYSDRAISSA